MTRAIILAGLLAVSCSKGRSQDRLIPSDTGFVIEIDVRKVMQSAVGRETVAPFIKSRIHEIPVLNQALNNLKIDPVHDLGKATLTAAGAKDSERIMIIARGTWNAASMTERLLKLSLIGGRNGLEKISMGTETLFRANLIENKSKGVFLTVTQDGALVISPSKDYIIEATKPKPALSLTNKKFQQVVAGMDEQSWVRFAVAGQAIDRAAVPDGPARELLNNVHSISGGAGFAGNEMLLDMALNAGDATAATAMRELIEDMANQSLGFLGTLAGQKREYKSVLTAVKAMRSSTRGSSVHIRTAMSRDDFKGILNLTGPLGGKDP